MHPPIFVLGPHSRQYFRTSLRLLLTLDYVPRKVKIPAPAIPHDCRLHLDVTKSTFCHRRPLKYVIANPRSRGRPRQDTSPPVSSTEESESESNDPINSSESTNTNDSLDSRTSEHDSSPLPPHLSYTLSPPESPPIPAPCPSNTS